MYKKIILLSISCLLSLSAQTAGFKGGLHLGLLATQVDGDMHSGFKKAGLFAGAFTNYSFIEKKIQLQFELNYAQKGSAANTVYRISLHQVEPTLLLKWNFWNNFLLECGLSFNIVASAKEYRNQTLTDPALGGSRFYKFHLGAIAGVGYRINEHWEAAIHCSYSSPIGRANTLRKGRIINDNMFSNCLLFRVGYQF